MREKCPRCESETFELGNPVIKVGKTREMRVAVRECPEYTLIFYERMKESQSESKQNIFERSL